MKRKARESRNRELVFARLSGVSYPVLERLFGLSERHCRRIVTADEDEHAVVRDALEFVEYEALFEEAAIDELAVVRLTSRSQWARIDAIRQQCAILDRTIESSRLRGMLPRAPREPFEPCGELQPRLWDWCRAKGLSPEDAEELYDRVLDWYLRADDRKGPTDAA